MSAKSNSAKWPKRLVIIAASLYFVYLLFGFFGVPMVTRNVLEKRLAGQFNRSITLREAKFNPFTLRLSLLGLKVDDDFGQPLLDSELISVNASMGSLFKLMASLDEAEVANTAVHFKITEDGGTNIDQLIATLDGMGAEEPQPEESEEPTQFYVGKVAIDGFRIEFEDQSREIPFRQTIGPIRLKTIDLESEVESASPYAFAATIGEETKLEWEGNVSVVPVYSSGKFTVSRIDLSKYRSYSYEYSEAEAQGFLSISGSYSAKTDEAGGGLRADWTDGAIELEAFSVKSKHTDDFSLSMPKISFRGINASWPETALQVEQFSIPDAEIRVTRDEEGNFILPVRERPLSETSSNVAAGPVEDVDSEEPMPNLRIANLNFDNWKIVAIDHSLETPAEWVVDKLTIGATGVAPFDENAETALSLDVTFMESSELSLTATANIAQQIGEGTIDMKQIFLRAAQAYASEFANVEILDGVMRGHFQFSADAAGPSATAQGSTEIQGIKIKDTLTNEEVLSLSALNLEGIDFDMETGLVIDKVTVDSPQALAIMDDEGINFTRIAKSNTPTEDSTANEGEPPSEPSGTEPQPADQEVALAQEETDAFPIHVNQLTLKEGKVSFWDNTIQPRYRTSLDSIQLTVDNVDTVKAEPSNIDFTAKFDKGGTLSAKGQAIVTGFTDSSDIELKIDSFDMSGTSPYWAKYLGRSLSKGSLNTETNVEFTNSEMDGRSQILINQLTLGEKVESKDSLGVPIGLAVAVMQNRQGVMDLPPISFSGDIEDPSVSVSGIVMKAIMNIVVKAATSPFSMLGKLGGGGGKGDPDKFEFSAGSVAIDDELRAKLDSMGTILVDRPGIRLDVVSTSATDQEREVLGKAALLRILSQTSAESAELPSPEAAPGIDSFEPVNLLESYQESEYESQLREAVSARNSAQEAAVAEASQSGGQEGEKRKGGVNIFKAVARVFMGSSKDKEATEGESNVEEGSPESASGVSADDPITAEELEAELMERHQIKVPDSWLIDIARERATRVKRQVLENSGEIDASRILVNNDSITTDPALSQSVVKFQLTD